MESGTVGTAKAGEGLETKSRRAGGPSPNRKRGTPRKVPACAAVGWLFLTKFTKSVLQVHLKNKRDVGEGRPGAYLGPSKTM